MHLTAFKRRELRKGTNAAFSFSVCAAAASVFFLSAAPAARAEVLTRGLLSRAITPAPAGADAVRVTVLGDGSGAKLQIRLLAPGQDGVLTGCYAAPPIDVTFKGWKTLVIPLSTFAFYSDTNPDAQSDGLQTSTGAGNATGIQLALTTGSGRLFLDDLGWTTTGAALTDPLLGTIDDFETAPALAAKTWKAGGDYSEIRALSFGTTQAASFVKSGTGALQMVVRTSANADDQLNGPVLNKKLKATPQMPYAIYARPPFETILPNSVPSVREVQAAPKLSIYACADQTEPTTFAVYSVNEIKNATVKITLPLTSAAKKLIPNANVDVRVVRVGEGLNAPELLMKDDRQSLVGPLPTVRLTGDPATTIAAETSKQFWVTVRVPKNQAPGVYNGKIVFSAPGVKPMGIALSVEVLPLPMKTAFLQYGMDFRSRLEGEPNGAGGPIVGPDVFAAQLANIRDHGFKIVTLYDRPTSLANALQIYKQTNVSLAGPIVVASPLDTGDISTVEGLRSGAGLTPNFELYYGLPDAAKNDPVVARSFANAVRSANRSALVTAPVASDAVYSALSDPLGDLLAPLYTMSSDHSQKTLAAGKRITPNHDWWSWNISRQSASRNRLFAGFLLFKAGNGFYGAFPGPYQYVPDGSDPYAAFTASAAGETTAPTAPLPQMVTYPVQGGVLDTIQWEAVRQGVDDIRYIGILKNYSRELKDLKLRKDATDLAESYLRGSIDKPLLSLTPAQQQATRRSIVDQALKLRAIMVKVKPG